MRAILKRPLIEFNVVIKNVISVLNLNASIRVISDNLKKLLSIMFLTALRTGLIITSMIKSYLILLA